MELASPRPKDLVVMVDKSGSMKVHHNGRSLMDIAIDAATTVINTLNPNDRVSSSLFGHFVLPIIILCIVYILIIVLFI